MIYELYLKNKNYSDTFVVYTQNQTIDSIINIEIKKAKLLYFAKASLTSDILLSKLGMAKNVLIKKFSKNR